MRSNRPASPSAAVSDLNNYMSAASIWIRSGWPTSRPSERGVRDGAQVPRVEPDGLCGLREDLHTQLSALQAAADIDSLREQTQAAQSRYDAAAASSARPGAGVQDLRKLVTQPMQTLAMQGPLRADAVTRDAVRARQRTGRIPGGRPCRHLAAPLAKVASGGELSRISLALSVIASRAACPR